jgi:hypothetical protein
MRSAAASAAQEEPLGSSVDRQVLAI